MIAYDVDDYLVINHSGKNQFGLCIGKKRLLLEKGVESDETTVVLDFEPEIVVANLGKEPAVGKVYGANVEPYRKTVQIPEWGNVLLYRKVSKKEAKTVKSAFAASYLTLSKHKATSWLKRLKHIELRSQTGKWAGTYKKNRSKDGEPTDVITLNNIPLDDQKHLEYVILHESAHGIWFHQVSGSIKSRWLELYAKRITVQSFNSKRLDGLLESLIKYQGSINDYMKEMADEEETVILKEVIAYIRKVHKLDKSDLDLLHDTGRSEHLRNVWPSIADISTSANDPSEYAMTRPTEFFAECISYYLTGTKMSKDIMKACQKTLEKLVQLY